MSDRTHGYVIRWIDSGFTHYSTEDHMVWDNVAKMNTPPFDLAFASGALVRIAAQRAFARIVRVRRVEGEPTYRDATGIEADEWGWRAKGNSTVVNSFGHYIILVRRVSAAPHWEIDPEDEP